MFKESGNKLAKPNTNSEGEMIFLGHILGKECLENLTFPVDIEYKKGRWKL